MNAASFRDRFVITDPNVIYLDGNSLGRLPKTAISAVQHAVEQQWGDRLIRGWNEHWLNLPSEISGVLAAILGVAPDEVALSDSTSVNLYKLASGCLRSQPNRPVILTDTENFPSDLYLLQGIAKQLNRELQIIEPSKIANALSDEVALLSLSHVAFRSGFVFDMAKITKAAHDKGAMVLWDLSHSVGAVPTPLRESHADFAVGCTYKHLHGGPGSPAFLFVRRDLQTTIENPIQGWFGQQSAFDFGLQYQPAEGIARFQVGTPPILSVVGCQTGINLVAEAGIDAIRTRSLQQTDRIIGHFDARLEPLGFSLLTPRNQTERGAHVTLGHPDAWRIVRSLIEDENVIPDFRAPDGVRLGPAPLYTTDDEIDRAIDAIVNILHSGKHLRFNSERPPVT
jgi:kynureninase